MCNMQTKVISKESVKIVLGEDEFYMNEAVFVGETKLSEIALVNGETDRKIVSSQPVFITLKGKVLPCDREFYLDLISQYSGQAIEEITIDETDYTDLVMIKGTLKLSDQAFVGECILQLKGL